MKVEMRTVKALILMLFASLAMSACGDTSTLPPPTKEENLFVPDVNLSFNNVSAFQLSYIRSLQLPSGAIKDHEQVNSRITPYFANYAAMALLTEPSEENLKAVRKYIDWYTKKLNRKKNPVTGGSEIEGSIYDYYAQKETTEGTYDSIDSYAATFLELVMRYAQLSPDHITWLRNCKSKISMVAAAMVQMIDTEKNVVPSGISPDANDYLSVASFSYPAKYLMDNCEVNMGLKAALWLQKNGLLDNEDDFSALLAGNTAAIERLFHKETYNWEKVHEADWSRFYADAIAQLYPGAFGVEVADAGRSTRLYSRFNANYKGWENGITFTPFPWTVVSYAAAVLGDRTRVGTYINHINAMNIKGQQKKGWYSGEAAFVVLAIDQLKSEEEGHEK